MVKVTASKKKTAQRTPTRKNVVEITVERHPNIKINPYVLSKLVNAVWLDVPVAQDSQSSVKIRVGNSLTESQVEHLVDVAKKASSEVSFVEITESNKELLLD
jgi:hypothetical protein